MEQPSVLRLVDVYRAALAYVDATQRGDASAVGPAFSSLESALALAQSSAEDQRLADADVLKMVDRLRLNRNAKLVRSLPSSRIAEAKKLLRSVGMWVRTSNHGSRFLYELMEDDNVLYATSDSLQLLDHAKKLRTRRGV